MSSEDIIKRLFDAGHITPEEAAQLFRDVVYGKNCKKNDARFNTFHFD